MAAPGACLAPRSPPAFLAGGFLAARPAALSPIPSRSGKSIAPSRRFIVSNKLAWVEDELVTRAKLRKFKEKVTFEAWENLSTTSGARTHSETILCRLQELSSVRQIHSAEGIAGMRAACKLAAHALDFAGTLIKPSVTTNEIDREVHNMIIEAGAYPSQLGYGGFPKSICTSLNECVCHGVPDSTQLQTGDIINVDVNVFLNGYHGGASRTFVCGEVDDSIRHFLKAAEECLEKGITVCRDGVNYKKIGKKISKLAYFYGYYVVDRFVGHGIGPIWHSEPLILHHANDNSGRMVEGQTFTIEPILTMEKAETVTWEDGWTTVTADGSWAAQFKHTVHMWQDYRSLAEELIDEICDESSVPGEWLVRRVCGSLEFCGILACARHVMCK
uniref:Methionine aminopeptidase n=1 Tax=Oryza glumipatula TaxID=40148 RepID=A0A0E0AKE4_9ORYZ